MGSWNQMETLDQNSDAIQVVDIDLLFKVRVISETCCAVMLLDTVLCCPFILLFAEVSSSNTRALIRNVEGRQDLFK